MRHGSNGDIPPFSFCFFVPTPFSFLDPFFVPQEQAVFDLWARCGLKDARFSGGNVVAFLKQLKSLL